MGDFAKTKELRFGLGVVFFVLMPIFIYVFSADVCQWLLTRYATISAADEIILRPILLDRGTMRTGITYSSFVLFLGPGIFVLQWFVVLFAFLLYRRMFSHRTCN